MATPQEVLARKAEALDAAREAHAKTGQACERAYKAHERAINAVLKTTPDDQIDRRELCGWAWSHTGANDRMERMVQAQGYAPQLRREGILTEPVTGSTEGEFVPVAPGMTLVIAPDETDEQLNIVARDIERWVRDWNVLGMPELPIHVMDHTLSENGFAELVIQNGHFDTTYVRFTRWSRPESIATGSVREMLSVIRERYYYPAKESDRDDEWYS